MSAYEVARVWPVANRPTPRSAVRGTEKQPLPWPDVLVLEDTPGAGVRLLRYTWTGASGGDSWHHTVQAARDQAAFEYGESLGSWVNVPADEPDALDFARRHLRDTQS